ncbi:retrovirus-related Pol polyprotein from transposon opus [Trichonephila clavipes]|nr:retrovirus-related Pol polyprotein from transposon opus [Trichonephila clavipes]
MWLYYCKLRGANDFESVNQLIVADKMFEMLDSETATHIGVLQGEEWYKPRDLGKQCDIFYASKGKSYDGPARAKWNDSEKRSFNGSWGQVTEIKKFACFTCGSDKHFKRNCPKNKRVDNKRLNVNKVSTEGTELEDGTVAARVDLLGKVIPRRAIEDKLSKLGKTSISVDGRLVHALVDSGTEITVIKKDLVPGISVKGASTIYLKGIFSPAVKCPLVYVPIGLATGGQVNVMHQQVLCALEEVLVEDVLLPPDVLDMLGGAQSEENSLAQSSQDLRVDSGNVDETEVSLGILPEKAQEHIEDSQRNITSCRNEVGTLGTKDEEVTAEMDKGSMVADSFRSEQECCAELELAWKHAKEGKGNYYEVDGYLFHRDKILGESIGQLGLRADVKKFCESRKECQLTRSVRVKDRSPITPVARPELPFQVVNMDLIGPIDPSSSKGHKYILCLVDQHTRWGEAMPVTSLSAKPGPNLNPNLLDVLINFRLNRVAISSDIRQAFLQICLADRHKDFVQFLWTDSNPRALDKKITWDEILPPKLKEKWFIWCKELPLLDHLRIPRLVLDSTNDEISDLIEIHIFCDASKLAYGAAAYVGRWERGHQRVNEGAGFSERTLDVEVDDPGLKEEQREWWPSRDPPPVVHKRDAEVDDPGLREKRATRTVAKNEKVSNHGSIPITIECNVVAFIVFEEGFHQPIKRTKQSVFLDVMVFRHTLVD